MGGGTDLAGPVFANTADNCRLGSRVTQLDDTAKYPYPPSHLPTSSASLVISWEVPEGRDHVSHVQEPAHQGSGEICGCHCDTNYNLGF